MSNRNATAANRTPVNTVLHQLEAYMGDHKLRGHVYLIDHTVVVFATRQTRAARPLDRNVGPEPVRRALAVILPPAEGPESWLEHLHGKVARQTRSPAPTLWNSPALVVTGAMASRALCAALEHEAAYPAETIDGLMHEAGVASDDVASMFEEVTGKPLRVRVTRTAGG